MVRISKASQAVNSSGEQIVDISSSAVVSVNDSTAQSSLSSLDTKITACDTSSLATSANQTSANALLSTIDSSLAGTLIVDGSSSTQPISASALPLPSGAATSANQTSANALLSTIDSSLAGTLIVDGSSSTQPVSGTVAVSSVSGTVIVDGSSSTQPVSGTVAVSSISGTVATTTTAPSVSGTNNNHLNNQTVSSSYQSTGFDVSGASRFSIMGNTTDQNNSIVVEFSPDNTNWYRANTELYPSFSDSSSPYDFYTAFDGACVAYVRLNFTNYTTLTEVVNATILTQ